MFKHILIPTDGSKLASKGIKAGVKLARTAGAKVTGVYVIPPYQPPRFSEGSDLRGVLTPSQYREQAEKEARRALAMVEIEAETAGVPCETRSVTASAPWQGILQVARARKCDQITLASHGRGALGGLLLGSETQRVLAHSRLPVLVCR